MANIFNHVECPNCGAQWTFEEINDQVCDACNFPNHKDDDNDFANDVIGPDDGADYDGPRGREADYEERDRMHHYQTHLK